MARPVTFAVGSPIALYAAVPLLRAVARRTTTYVVAPKALQERVRELGVTASRILPLEGVGDRLRRWSTWHGRVMRAITPIEFSNQYGFVVDQQRHLQGRRLGWGRLGVAKDAINAQLSRGFARAPVVFPTEHVIAVSHFPYPVALCSGQLRVTTLTESWDHAAKRPAGYRSDRVLTWNADLGIDWQLFQDPAAEVVVGGPTKLRWAFDAQWRRRDRGQRPALMYPALASRATPHAGMFDQELDLITQLANAADRAGWDVLVKPKPNGQPGEFDEMGARLSNVHVGRHGTGAGLSGYWLDDEYNRERAAELSRVDLVVNVGTTFGLDAACVGAPVMQLDVRDRSGWPVLARAQRNHHLDRWLLRPDMPAVRTTRMTFERDIATALSDRSEDWAAWSERQRAWLLPAGTIDDVVEAAAAALEEE